MPRIDSPSSRDLMRRHMKIKGKYCFSSDSEFQKKKYNFHMWYKLGNRPSPLLTDKHTLTFPTPP
jgi:hypothetical protein